MRNPTIVKLRTEHLDPDQVSVSSDGFALDINENVSRSRGKMLTTLLHWRRVIIRRSIICADDSGWVGNGNRKIF